MRRRQVRVSAWISEGHAFDTSWHRVVLRKVFVDVDSSWFNISLEVCNISPREQVLLLGKYVMLIELSPGSDTQNCHWRDRDSLQNKPQHDTWDIPSKQHVLKISPWLESLKSQYNSVSFSVDDTLILPGSQRHSFTPSTLRVYQHQINFWLYTFTIQVNGTTAYFGSVCLSWLWLIDQDVNLIKNLWDRESVPHLSLLTLFGNSFLNEQTAFEWYEVPPKVVGRHLFLPGMNEVLEEWREDVIRIHFHSSMDHVFFSVYQTTEKGY